MLAAAIVCVGTYVYMYDLGGWRVRRGGGAGRGGLVLFYLPFFFSFSFLLYMRRG